MQNNSLQTALERLFRRRTFGVKLGLEVEQALLEGIGHPERACGIIHVAGTNGKGSVCAILESILKAAGYRVGLCISPHLVNFNERMRVQGESVSDEELGPLIEMIEQAASAVAEDRGQDPTFFECATAMALEHFRRHNVQIAVIETGMGGRLDATNVVTPVVSVITRISLDHTGSLGLEVESVAQEKCGIIKPGIPVVCGMMEDAALAVVKSVAAERGSPLTEAGESVTIAVRSAGLSGQKVHVETASTSYGLVRFPLLGAHQVENLATAVAALEVLRDVVGLGVSESDVKDGVPQMDWQGRFQLLGHEPPVVLDGAHNPGAAKVLAATLRKSFKGKPVGLVLGMCRDKDARGFLEPLSHLVKRAWIVPIGSERNMPAAKLCAAAQSMACDLSEAGVRDALKEARHWAADTGGVVCVTGSLYLVGEVLGM